MVQTSRGHFLENKRLTGLLTLFVRGCFGFSSEPQCASTRVFLTEPQSRMFDVSGENPSTPFLG
jgi:hypothetical protein